MRLLPLLALLLSGCSSMKSFQMPWNTRAKEQAKVNETTAPKPKTREDEILHPDETKEFNLNAANFGRVREFQTGKAQSSEFYFVDKTRTKGFRTFDYGTGSVRDANSSYGTKTAATKESRFSGMTAGTKTYDTREARDANKTNAVRELPDAGMKYYAKGRRQGEYDSDREKGRAPKLSQGGDRDAGQSWNGELKPLSIQDVKNLLNRN